eukprot:603041-Prymnesium_polylepis.1
MRRVRARSDVLSGECEQHGVVARQPLRGTPHMRHRLCVCLCMCGYDTAHDTADAHRHACG